MPRVALTPDTVVGPYPITPLTTAQAKVNKVAGDASSGNSFPSSGKDLIIAHNTGAGANTITISSIKDEHNRKGDITTYSLAAGTIHAFLVGGDGWRQSDGSIYIDVSNAEIQLGVLRLP